MMEMYVFVVFLIAGGMASPVDVMYQAEEDSVNAVMVKPSVSHKDHDTRDEKVAFYVLFDGTLPSAGKGQHLKFNKVLLNDGDGYSPHSGVFRAPKCGLYSFSYSVSAKYPKTAKASLMVQGKHINGAFAESTYYSQTSQGSNSAIVHMHKGEEAWIGLGQGSSPYNEVDISYNNFSGFLLYTRE